MIQWWSHLCIYVNKVLRWVSFGFFVWVFEGKPLLVQLHISLGWMKVVLLLLYNEYLHYKRMGFLISQSWQTFSKIKNVFALQLNIFILCENKLWSMNFLSCHFWLSKLKNWLTYDLFKSIYFASFKTLQMLHLATEEKGSFPLWWLN